MQAGFGGGVGGGVGAEHFAGDRGDVDDRAALALLDQPPPEDLAHVERAGQVDIDHDAPEFGVDLNHGHAVRAARGAGIVDHEVDAPEFVDGLRKQTLDGGVVGDIGNDGERAAAGRLHLFGDGVDIAPAGGLFVVGVVFGRAAGAGQHDVAARLGEFNGDWASDAAHPSRAGDDGDLVFETGELHGVLPLWRLCGRSSGRSGGFVVFGLVVVLVVLVELVGLGELADVVEDAFEVRPVAAPAEQADQPADGAGEVELDLDAG